MTKSCKSTGILQVIALIVVGVAALTLLVKRVASPPPTTSSIVSKAKNSKVERVNESSMPSNSRIEPSVVDQEVVVGSTLEIKFVTPRGESVEGVISRLYTADPDLTYRAASGESGICRWDKLPNGKYRWSLESNHHAAIHPPYESGIEVDGSSILSYGRGESTRMSGAFALANGEKRQYLVTVLQPAMIFGRTNPGARVSVSYRKDFPTEDPGGLAVRAYRLESAVTAGEDGYFELRDLAPGTKLIRAEWAEIPQEFYCATASVTLEQGAIHDLGILSPVEGGIRGKIVLTTGERVVDPSTSFDGPTKVELVVSSRPTIPEDGRMASRLAVNLGQEFTISGLRSGDYTIHVSFLGHGWPESTSVKVVEDRPIQRSVSVIQGVLSDLQIPVRVTIL